MSAWGGESKALISPWKQGRLFVDGLVPYATVPLDSVGRCRNHGAYGRQKHSWWADSSVNECLENFG